MRLYKLLEKTGTFSVPNAEALPRTAMARVKSHLKLRANAYLAVVAKEFPASDVSTRASLSINVITAEKSSSLPSLNSATFI